MPETTLADFVANLRMLGETVTVTTEDGRTFKGRMMSVSRRECIQHVTIGYAAISDPIYQADLKTRVTPVGE